MSKQFPKREFPKKPFVLEQDDLNYVNEYKDKTVPVGSGATVTFWKVFYLGRQIKKEFCSEVAALAHLEFLIVGDAKPEWK